MRLHVLTPRLLALLVAGLPLASAAQLQAAVIISEFMALNDSTLADEDGDYSDWLELCNVDTQQVNLGGWYLTDDGANPAKWQFPATNLAAGGYLLVFASDKNRRVAGAPLHTSFKLSGGGEYLGLVAPGGTTIACEYAPAFPSQFEDISYGISSQAVVAAAGGTPVSPDDWRYFPAPTPGGPNSDGYAGFVAPVAADVRSGFVAPGTTVTLSCATAGTTIRYTLNADPPGAAAGFVYTNPLVIARSTVLRAAAFKPNWLQSAEHAATYILLDNVLTQGVVQSSDGPYAPDFPAEWVGYSNPNDSGTVRVADYEVDQRIVTNPLFHGQVANALTSLPTVALALSISNLFDPWTGIYVNPKRTGDAWERAVGMQWIEPGGGTSFHVNAGVQIMGRLSRTLINPKYSLRIVFKSQYGPATVHYPFFPDAGIEKYNTLALRGNYTDGFANRVSGTNLKDVYMHQVLHDVGGEPSRFRWVHLYIDGLYWGVYELLERPDDAFQSTHFGGEREEWDVLKGESTATLMAGSRELYDEMIDLVSTNAVVNDADCATLQRDYLDMERYFPYVIINQQTGNGDWPRANWYTAARRDGSNTALRELFRFYSWDGDLSLRSLERINPLTYSGHDNGPGRIYNRLLGRADFQRRFGDELQRLLFNDGPLVTTANQARVYGLARQLEAGIAAECARWGDAKSPDSPATPLTWSNSVRSLVNFFASRNAYVLSLYVSNSLFSAVAAPQFSQHGGAITPGFELGMSGAGAIYFTTNGMDPWEWPTGLCAAAVLYTNPVQLDVTTRLRARASVTGVWSACNEAVFVVDSPPFRLSELMYHPANPPPGGDYDADAFEFVEIVNVGAGAWPLAGLSLTGSVCFAFSGGSAPLPASACVLIVRDAEAFASRYPTNGMRIAGEYAGKLANDTSVLELRDATYGPIVSVRYYDWWRPPTDGDGFALEVTNLLGACAAWSDRGTWLAGTKAGGTPGYTGIPEPGILAACLVCWFGLFYSRTRG